MIFKQEEFFKYLRTERSCSPSTIDVYTRDLNRLDAWLEQAAINHVPTINRKHLTEFAMNMSYDGLSANTRRRTLACFRTYFKFLKNDGYIADNPAEDLTLPERSEGLPNYISEPDVDKIITACITLEEKAIVGLLYGGGLRASELAGVLVENIDLDRALVTIVGKGDKVRTVPVGRHAADAISSYMTTCVEPKGRLFELSRQDVWRLVKRVANRAGVENVYPHLFRHTFATHLMKNGAGVRIVQQMLGHDVIDTTMIYTHVSNEQLKETYYKFHPRK